MLVQEDVPADIKGKDDTKGAASLKGHLTQGGDEGHGSSAYVPTDPAKDTQLIAAEDLLRGVKTSANAPNEKPAAPKPTEPLATAVKPGAPAPEAPTTGGVPKDAPPAKVQ